MTVTSTENSRHEIFVAPSANQLADYYRILACIEEYSELLKFDIIVLLYDAVGMY
jgi:hypothetical protein